MKRKPPFSFLRSFPHLTPEFLGEGRGGTGFFVLFAPRCGALSTSSTWLGRSRALTDGSAAGVAVRAGLGANHSSRYNDAGSTATTKS